MRLGLFRSAAWPPNARITCRQDARWPDLRLLAPPLELVELPAWEAATNAPTAQIRVRTVPRPQTRQRAPDHTESDRATPRARSSSFGQPPRTPRSPVSPTAKDSRQPASP